jgi:trimeric autotransporter adhesin
LGSASGTFVDKNVGSNLAYDINNIALSGEDASNYYLLGGSFSGTNGTISARDVTIGGLVAQNKVYDGTNAATVAIAGAALSGLVAGDSVALDSASLSALFANKHVGTGKAITVGGFGLSGADAGNYNLMQPTGLAANITPAPLTVTAATNRKTYDGTANAASAPRVTSGGLMTGDRFTTFIERYDTARPGLGLTLDPFVAIEDGNGGANYAITLVSDTTGEILPSIDLSQLGGSNTATRLDTSATSAGDHRRRRELDEEHRLPMVKVIATGLKLPQGMAAGASDDFKDFEDGAEAARR